MMMIALISWSWIRAMCCCLALLVQVCLCSLRLEPFYLVRLPPSSPSLIIWTGKTLLAKTLARLVNVPFAIADATSLTQASCFHLSLLDFGYWLWQIVARMYYISEKHWDVLPFWKSFWKMKWRFLDGFKRRYYTGLHLSTTKTTLLVQAGYVGEDVESILYKLYVVWHAITSYYVSIVVYTIFWDVI